MESATNFNYMKELESIKKDLDGMKKELEERGKLMEEKDNYIDSLKLEQCSLMKERNLAQ